MMEITNEIKAKVFAQYLGQNVISNSLSKSNGLLYKVSLKNSFGCFEDKDGHFHDFNVENLKLILKPLDKITDEDAIEVAKIIYETDEVHICEKISVIHGAKEQFKKGWSINLKNSALLYQYLQSKGFDTPQYLLGGKTLHECGLCIYE